MLLEYRSLYFFDLFSSQIRNSTYLECISEAKGDILENKALYLSDILKQK